LVQNTTWGRPTVTDRRCARAAWATAGALPARLKCRHLEIEACCRIHCDLCRGFRLRRILLHLGQRVLELLKHGATLRGLSEPLVPELGHCDFICSINSSRRAVRLPHFTLLLPLQPRLLRGDDHRLERRDVLRERISSGRHDPIAAQTAVLASLNRGRIHNVDKLNPRLRSLRSGYTHELGVIRWLVPHR